MAASTFMASEDYEQNQIYNPTSHPDGRNRGDDSDSEDKENSTSRNANTSETPKKANDELTKEEKRRMRRQSRKSLGRRVSFAPTAHVRYVEENHFKCTCTCNDMILIQREDCVGCLKFKQMRRQ